MKAKSPVNSWLSYFFRLDLDEMRLNTHILAFWNCLSYIDIYPIRRPGFHPQYIRCSIENNCKICHGPILASHELYENGTDKYYDCNDTEITQDQFNAMLITPFCHNCLLYQRTGIFHTGVYENAFIIKRRATHIISPIDTFDLEIEAAMSLLFMVDLNTHLFFQF